MRQGWNTVGKALGLKADAVSKQEWPGLAPPAEVGIDAAPMIAEGISRWRVIGGAMC